VFASSLRDKKVVGVFVRFSCHTSCIKLGRGMSCSLTHLHRIEDPDVRGQILDTLNFIVRADYLW
jgi:hypothetical protein